MNMSQLHYSLRSRSDNPAHADVAAIAHELGGGGHRHAAGFHAKSAVHIRQPARGLNFPNS
jgi:nanoRNase/pAp phosphatase (c-di-AMP/oligoRNAs hydrolase)